MMRLSPASLQAVITANLTKARAMPVLTTQTLRECHKKPHKPCAVSEGTCMVPLTLFHQEKQLMLLLTMHVSTANEMELASMQRTLVQA